jgi:hypothetical protein
MDSFHVTAREIIADGVKAPSGENMQPWRFVVQGHTIFLCNIVMPDLWLYNYGQFGSYVGHGACIENMVISATHYGYAATVEYFPASEGEVVARLTFAKTNKKEDALYPYLSTRHTNRGDFERKKLPVDAKNLLIEEAERLGVARGVILDGDADIAELAEASTSVERLIFESKGFHHYYYEHTFFSQSNEHLGDGFYVNVLGLNAFEKIGMAATKLWPFARFVGASGMWYPLSKMRAAHYARSGAFGAITTPGSEPKHYLDGGRSFVRLWLTATKLGISLQPCVGVLFLYDTLTKEEMLVLSPHQLEIVRRGRNRILERLGDAKAHVPMFFRLGYAQPPRTRSFRSPPLIYYLD